MPVEIPRRFISPEARLEETEKRSVNEDLRNLMDGLKPKNAVLGPKSADAELRTAMDSLSTTTTPSVGSLDEKSRALERKSMERVALMREAKEGFNHFMNPLLNGNNAWQGIVKSVSAKTGQGEDACRQAFVDEYLRRQKTEQKGNLRHYRRVSMSEFETACELSAFLKPSEAKELKPGLELRGVVRDHIHFTRDSYDSQGRLSRDGLDNTGVGAAGSDVVVVFNEGIFNTKGYLPMQPFPLSDEVPFRSNVECVIVNEGNREKVRQTLSQNALIRTPIYTMEEFKKVRATK